MTNLFQGFIPSFREAMRTREPTMLVSTDGSLPEYLLAGIEWRGFEEPCREAVIFPVRPTNDENVVGFLLLGINPRRPFDDDYKSFVYMLDRQLATSLASVILFEDEIKAGRTAAEQAAIERAHLSALLETQTRRLEKMTASSPVGMFYLSAEGLLLEANDRYYEMTGHPRGEGSSSDYNLSWMEYISEESKPDIQKGWDQLSVEGRPWSGELKMKRRWIVEDVIRDYYVLAAAHPEFDKDGKLTSVMGSITDISSQKYLSEEALKRARLSEELVKSERNFKRFSDLSPGGLVVMDGKGHITYANNQWFQISGHPKEASHAGQISWETVVHPDYLDYAEKNWRQLYTNHSAFTMNIRMKKPWITGTGTIGETWILASASPEVNAEGKLTGIMSCITDISHIKWTEGLQNRRLEEAEATRRQQNNFIDIVSHEMRNPIGAILVSPQYFLGF
jgi:PAS domain S-box-containing protein